MKKNKIIRASKLLWMLLSFLFIGLQSFSQTSTQKITGKIINKTTGAPVADASISVKNTNNATLSDVAGNFAINAKAGETIVISFIGFITQSITVNSSTENLQIQLIEEYNKLDEVVLIGYGSQQKKFVTGATSQVSGKDLAKLNTTNALQALQGQAAGVNITSVSGQPGGGFKVNIRGAGTIGNASPLYVVDGVITGDITYLNDADIASVDILKDAASSAIYGINGANGVVLITTKSGKSSNRKDGQVSFDAYYGVQNVARKADLLNAEQYATIQNEAALNSGKPLLFTQSQINALGSGTNWLNQMFSSNVPIQNFNLGINGGSDISSYSLGLSYTAQGGIGGGSNLSNYQRYNFHTNSERKLYNGALRVGEHLTFSYIDQKGIADGGIYNTTLRGAFTTSPLLAMYDSSGNFLNSMNSTVYNGGPWNNGEANPYALMVYNNQHDTKSQKVLGDVYAELQPFQNMTIKSTFGVEYNSAAGHSYTPAYKNLSIYAYNNYEGIGQSSSQGLTWNWDNT
ncbi:MAG TPA: SusC/RagA family TonB-linked outer membrane protein, partial [Hanamia sp.]